MNRTVFIKRVWSQAADSMWLPYIHKTKLSINLIIISAKRMKIEAPAWSPNTKNRHLFDVVEENEKPARFVHFMEQAYQGTVVKSIIFTCTNRACDYLAAELNLSLEQYRCD